MLRRKDKHKAKIKQKKIGWLFWDKQPMGFFRKNHSLTCGCQQCKWIAFIKRKENKRDRKKAKLETDKLKDTDYYTEYEKEFPID